jgi:Na+/H+-dicarboxylate symporter
VGSDDLSILLVLSHLVPHSIKFLVKRLSLTTWSILALTAGLGLGILGHEMASPTFDRIGEWTKTIGNLWIAALQLTVLPLVITHLLATIAGVGAKSVGKLGIRAFLLFLGMLLASGLFTIILTPLFLSRFSLGPGTVATLKAAAASSTTGSSIAAEPNASTISITDWISGLLPTNILEAGVRGDIFSLLLFTGFFALAVTRLPPDRHLLLTTLFQGLAEAMLQLVRWVLVATPIGVFALAYVLALKTSVSTGGILGAYILIVSVIMVLFTLLLYPFSAFVSRTRISDFARGVAPAQFVAVSSRSSIAALPALVEGGRDRLHLPSTGKVPCEAAVADDTRAGPGVRNSPAVARILSDACAVWEAQEGYASREVSQLTEVPVT